MPGFKGGDEGPPVLLTMASVDTAKSKCKMVVASTLPVATLSSGFASNELLSAIQVAMKLAVCAPEDEVAKTCDQRNEPPASI